MLYDDLRLAHEDLERLEQGISDRILEDTSHNNRARLFREHEIAQLVSRIKTQSERAYDIYAKQSAARTQELQSITTGDTFESFFDAYHDTKQFHKRYPNEQVDNLEKAYKRIDDGGPSDGVLGGDLNNMFRAQEGFGQYFDLTLLHEQYLNLPGVRGVKRPNYTQYLETFDSFTPPACTITRKDKMTDDYFSYVRSLAEYLESFLQRIRPLENLNKLFQDLDEEFDQAWKNDDVPGWESAASRTAAGARPATEGTGEGIWCSDCSKEFTSENTYKAHLSGKKHIKNAAQRTNGSSTSNPETDAVTRLKERAVAEREFRVKKLAETMKTQREDTRAHVERQGGLTGKERQQEIYASLAAEDDYGGGAAAIVRESEEQDGDEKVYNPFKIPLGWDGKPIPYWLWKLHGLGVELSCEICGNFVYMGRRAFEKHFSEQRHIYGLQCLGINKHTGLFREITKIDEAAKLWNKLQRDQQQELERKGGETGDGVVEMEDSMGNVMPKAVYDDLVTAGLL